MASSNASKARNHKEKGNEFFKEGKLVESIQQYSQAQKLDPNDPVYPSNLSAALYEIGDYKACVDAICTAARKCPEENVSLRTKLSARLAKALCHGVKGGKIELERVGDAQDVLSKLRYASSGDAAQSWPEWDRVQKEASRALNGAAEARLRLSRLPMYKKAEQMDPEYYSIGQDPPMSIIDDWGSSTDDEYPMHVSKYNNSELSNLSFMFGGCGDARHVFGSIAGLQLAYEKLKTDQKKSVRAHFTLLDIHPTALSRDLIFFVLLNDILEARDTPEVVDEIRATLFYAFTAVLMPSYCYRRFMDVASRLIEGLQQSPPELPSWLHVSKEAISDMVAAIQFWVDKLPSKTAKRFLDFHDMNKLGDSQRILLSPGLESFNDFVEKRKQARKDQMAAVVAQLPDEVLISTFSGKGDNDPCPPPSQPRIRKQWLKDAREMFIEMAQEKEHDPAGAGISASVDVDLENTFYTKIASVFIPPRSLQKRHPALKKAWENLRNISKGKSKERGDLKSVEDDVHSTWRPNPSLFATWTEGKLGGYPDMQYNPFTLIGFLDEFNERFNLGASAEYKDDPSPCFGVTDRFFEGVLNAFKTMKGKITIEFILGDISFELVKMRLKSDVSRPSGFPREYTRMWLSNVPDYTNGPMNTALYAVPSLQNVRNSAVSSNCLLNTGLWTSDDLFCHTYTQLLTKEVPRFLGSQVLSMKALFGHITLSRGAFPLPLDKLATRSELNVWLTRVLFNIFSPMLPQAGSVRVSLPNNLVVFIDMLLHLQTVGFPAHWLSEYLSSVLRNEVISSAVPYRGESPLPVQERYRSVKPRQINFAPWIADFENVLAEAYDAIPFALRLPADKGGPAFAVSAHDMGLYECSMKGFSFNPAPLMGGCLWAAKDPTISLMFYRPSAVSPSSAAARAADVLEGKLAVNKALLYLTVVDAFDTKRMVVRWKMSKERMKAMKREGGWMMNAYRAERFSQIDAVFFGGDLCQTGGGYSADDQALLNPALYRGGEELQSIQALYVRGDDGPPHGLTKLKYNPKFFGLGNHDSQSDEHPLIGWEGGDFVSQPVDYFRYQMYNFIDQMHYSNSGKYPIEYHDIDTDRNNSSYDWKKYSMNYLIDLGPVDVFQLHWFGGCDRDGRASGMQWLKDRLEERGVDRPLIIVQHASFFNVTETSAPDGTSWTYGQKMALLEILQPYNVIALLTGHTHWNNFNMPISVPGRKTDFREFNVGTAAADDGENYSFAVLHVTSDRLDVLYGRSSDASDITWYDGVSIDILVGERRLWVDPSPANYENFGPLNNSKYAESSAVICPPGKEVVSVGFFELGNRLAPQIRVANADGTGKQDVKARLENYFPSTNGLEDFYADTNPVSAPEGWKVLGLFIKQKGNRISPALIVFDPKHSDKETITITNDEMNGNYIGPLKHRFAKTTLMDAPTLEQSQWVVVGWAFTDNVPGVDNQVGVRVLYERQGHVNA